MNETAISTGHPDAVRVYAAAYQATMERYNVLQDELHNARVAASDTHGLIESYEESKKSLQQRLTTVEQFVQKLIACSKNQDSIATGYLSDILDVIKGN